MKRCYRIYICPECSDQSQYAGFCDTCIGYPRLAPIMVIPAHAITEERDKFVKNSSPVPAEFIRRFVDSLLSLRSPPSG